MSDHLTLCSEKRLRELLAVEKELELARQVIEAAREFTVPNVTVKSVADLIEALKAWDERSK